MNAVIYARYSSAGQTEQSIEGQLRVCHEFAERNDYIILNEYIDRAISGTSDKRPAFLQMIEDASKKKFEYIIVYKLDRFSRNKYDSVFYKHKLKEYGVKVISATEAISDSPEGRLVEGILEMMAEMYSQDLSQKVKRGIRESLLKNNFIGGTAPYGYKIVDKKLVIDEETAPVMRYYFEQYASGKPKVQIIKELNNMGYRNAKGKPFTKSSLQNCLSNTKYIGIYNVNGMELEEYCPALVSKEVFEQVQKMLKKHKHSPASNKAKEEYLLTGKLFCGMCGSGMVGVSTKVRKDKESFCYYACSDRLKTHRCIKKYEKKGFIEWYVVEQARQKILDPTIREKIIDRVYEEIKKNASAIKIAEYERKIKQIENELDKCFEMYLSADTKALKSRADQKAKDLEALKVDIQNELFKIKITNKSMKTKNDIENYFNLFTKGDELDINLQRRIINTLIDSVYLLDDEVTIYFDIFNEKQVSFIDFANDVDNIGEVGEVFTDGNFVSILNTTPRQH